MVLKKRRLGNGFFCPSQPQVPSTERRERLEHGTYPRPRSSASSLSGEGAAPTEGFLKMFLEMFLFLSMFLNMFLERKLASSMAFKSKKRCFSTRPQFCRRPRGSTGVCWRGSGIEPSSQLRLREQLQLEHRSNRKPCPNGFGSKKNTKRGADPCWSSFPNLPT